METIVLKIHFNLNFVWLQILLILYWTLCLVCGTGVLLYKSFISNSKSDTATRKAYHVLAVLVYIPGLMLEPVLLYLASGVVFALFIFFDVSTLF